MALSAIVTTYNEERIIGRCLAALAFSDEVVVVDSFSADCTIAIAEQHGARVLSHEYTSPAAQKNWAIPQARGEWILIVDADELVTPGLADEIRRVISSPGARDGYWIRRRNRFLGREIRWSGWQRDWVLRLFRKDRGRYLDRQVHERLEVAGTVGRLREPMLHDSYRTLDDYWRKLDRYATWGAAEARRRGERVSPARLLLHPPLRFLKAYLLQGGILDGGAGLAVCLLTAISAAAKDLRIWEQQLSAAGRGRQR